MYNQKRIGQRLKGEINDAGMTITGLAEMLGVKRETVSNWCCGTRAMTLETAIAICDLLGCSIERLTCQDEIQRQVTTHETT